jgi:hypothetical protein
VIDLTIQQAEEIAAQKGCTIFDLINEWVAEAEIKEEINQSK